MKKWLKNWWFSILMFAFDIIIILYVAIGYFLIGNDDTFIYIAGFGLFTEISYDTPQELKNVLGHAAYILSAAKSLATIPNYLMQVEANGEVIEDRFIYGMITYNTTC